MASFPRQLHTLGARVACAAFASTIAACSDAPIVLSSQHIESPDAKRSAIVEELDNGMGFGLGALIYEVHVVRVGEQARRHGEAGRSVVFYADISEYRGPPITVQWLSSDRLQVTYGNALTPGKRVSRLGSVAVEYLAQ